ncbi:MAG: DUF2059 domain-containing protein [Victivallaceae bacterium]
MKKYLSVMSALVCLSLITGCASADKAKCDKAEKAEKCEKKTEKAAVCPKAEKAKQEQAAADLAKRKELAEQLLITLKADKAVANSFEELKKNQKATMPRQLKAKQVPNPQEVVDAVIGLMTVELTWNKCKDAFITSYAEAFTAEDLDALIKFHQSEVGKKYVDCQSAVHKKNYEAMRNIMMVLLPKADKLSQDIIEKQKAAAKAAAPAPAAAKPAEGCPAQAAPGSACNAPAAVPAPATPAKVGPVK